MCDFTSNVLCVSRYAPNSFGYPNYLYVVEFPNVKCLWADVMCQYWPWAVSHSPDEALKVLPCLSVMHSCAHSWHCRVYLLSIKQLSLHQWVCVFYEDTVKWKMGEWSSRWLWGRG